MNTERYSVLVVDDSRTIRTLLRARLHEESPIEVLEAEDFTSARKVLDTNRERLLCAVADLNLPDAPDGEVVDYLLEQQIPVIVLTGNSSETVREMMIAKRIVDYVVKQNASELDYVVNVVLRLENTVDTSVLVVDDSSAVRVFLRNLLETQLYPVLEASSGKEALAVLQDNPNIRVVVTDYEMPEMNGLELVYKIRRTRGRNDLIIVAMSGERSGSLSARLLKAGANDFLKKPFLPEEFLCRINQNVDLVERIHTIRDAANRDYLTRLYNRRYFFEAGKTLLTNALRGGIQLGLAVLDIDFFKSVNDTYGHEAGDVVLIAVARILDKTFRRTDIVARFGGEEFCVLAVGQDEEDLLISFERARRQIEEIPVEWKNKTIRMTCSIGVCKGHRDDLQDMVQAADCALYKAKAGGRNRMVIA